MAANRYRFPSGWRKSRTDSPGSGCGNPPAGLELGGFPHVSGTYMLVLYIRATRGSTCR